MPDYPSFPFQQCDSLICLKWDIKAALKDYVTRYDKTRY
jgi:hypothetical protein